MLSDATVHPALPETLGDYTRPNLILPELRQSDTAGMISELSHALLRSGSIPDLLPFYHTALNQELLGNSVLGCGIAFPHARVSSLKRLQFAIGRTAEPVVWGTKGSLPVQFVFLMAVPATEAAGYLHLLASLARLGQQPEVLRKLRTAVSAEELHRILLSLKLRPS